MATKYWVGGTGTWDATSSARWSDSSGGPGGAIAPCALDDVVFNSSSNATAYTVTISTGAVCKDLTISGPASGNVTVAGTARLPIYGSLTLSATGITRTYTGPIDFRATTTGNTITTNGVSLASNISFVGSGGDWTLGSALTTTGALSVNFGTFSTGNFALSFSDLSASAGSSIINLGSSSVTVSGSFGSFSSEFCTLNAGTSTITASSATFNLGLSTHVGSTFYNLSLTSAAKTSTLIYGANTFNNLTFTTPTNSAANLITLYGNQTVTGTLTVAGSGAINRYVIESSEPGVARTLTVGTVATLTDVDFFHITVAGASSPWSGTRLGNCGGNTNITFNAGVNKYWNRAAGGAWTSTSWATSSGGTAAALDFPLPQDTAIIENTGLNTGASITGFSTFCITKLDCSTRTNAATITGTQGRITGDLTLSTSMTVSSLTLDFIGTGTQNITSAGRTLSTVRILCSGTISLADAFTANIGFNKGTFTTNNQNVTSSSTTFGSGFAKTLNLGSSTISFDSFGSASAGLNTTVNAGTSNITITGTTATIGFEGITSTFYNVTCSAAGFTTITFAGTNTFNNLTFTSPTVQRASSILLRDVNITVNGTLAFGGGTSVTQRIRVVNLTVGVPKTITAATVTGLTDIDFRDITAAGAGNWTTGTRLGDCGGNTGITFPAAKTVYWNLAGAQNWRSTGWATGSGGVPAVNNFPLAQDTAVFDDTGAAGTITLDAASYTVGTINASARTSAMTLAGSQLLQITNDVTLGSGVTVTYTGNLTFTGPGTQQLTTAGKTLSGNLIIQKPSSAVFNHADAATTSATISVLSGTYQTQNFAITASTFSSTTAGTRTVNFGSSAVTLTATTSINFNNVSGLNFNAGTSTINLSNAGNKTFNGGDQTFYNVSNTGGTTTTALTIFNNNRFNTLSNTANQDITFANNTTQYFAAFNYTGALGSVVDINTNTPGLRATLIKFSGVWYAGANSTDGGNNSGWTFTAGGSTDYAYIKDTQVFVNGLQPARLDNTNVFYSPTVTGVSGTHTISPGLFTNTQTFFAATLTADVVALATGVAATGQLGSVTILTATLVNVAGVQAQGLVGALSATGGATVNVTGVQATGQTGTVSVALDQVVPVAGVQAAGQIGSVVTAGEANVAVTGVQANGQTGTVVIQLVLAVPVAGVQAQGFVNSVVVRNDATVVLAGVQAVGLVGFVNVWGLVPDTQNPNWQDISDVQSPVWGTVANMQTPGWVQITDTQTPVWMTPGNTQSPNWTQVIN